jgi:hypothetical protein
MPQTTIAQACRDRGIDRKDWDEAKRRGIDPWNREAMAEWLGSKRHRIAPGAEMKEGIEAQTLEQMEDAIRKATDIDSVKILKEKLAALKIAVQVRTETRELVPVGEVRESMTRCVSVARGELLKLASDLPPRLAGLSEATIQSIIRESIIDTLTRLSDETNEIYSE